MRLLFASCSQSNDVISVCIEIKRKKWQGKSRKIHKLFITKPNEKLIKIHKLQLFKRNFQLFIDLLTILKPNDIVENKY